MSGQDNTRVLIAGAGPTGLTAAVTLVARGVRVRVVDRRTGPATEPKALILWGGALEVLDRLGVADATAERALSLESASYWARGRRLGGIRFTAGPRCAGAQQSRFPGPLCVPQSVTEELLYERLLELGGEVQWSTEVVAAEAGADSATLWLRRADGAEETARGRWLIGADGIRSTVRESLHIPFTGSTYDRDFLLGDGKVSGGLPEFETQYHLTPDGVLVVVPLPGGGHRVFFDLPPGSGTERPGDEELQQLLDARGPGGWRIDSTWWTSRFQVHARVAERFRSGAAFLAGDAAHCHSPAGGQGLNTGVQDAFDLGWKLAAVHAGADSALLDSYQVERRPASLRVVRNADRQTRMWMARSPLARTARDTLLRVLDATGALERRVVPELTQLDPDLTASPAVRRADALPYGVRCGRRVPDAILRAAGAPAATLHEYLAAGRHTLLVLGDGSAAQRAAQEAQERFAALPAGAAEVLRLAPGEARFAVSTPSPEPPLAVYVRPDGIVGGAVGPERPGSVAALLRDVPGVPGPRPAKE